MPAAALPSKWPTRHRPNRLLTLALLAWFLVLPTLSAGTLVQFRTAVGELQVELLDQDKPITVANFLRYLKAGRYRNIFLHRCIPGFIVQGGGYLTTNRFETNLFTIQKVFSYSQFPPIMNEYSVGRTFSNTYGTLAMARVGGQTNSATSQWFFNLGPNGALDSVDGGFTVFGLVHGSTNLLQFFNSLSLHNGIVRMGNYTSNPTMAQLFQDLPVLYTGTAAPALDDLLYVDITLLQVEILPGPNSSRIIRWNSVLNHTNRVEYTDTFPPNWKTLLHTNGTGGTIQVTDTELQVPHRFYRVTVD